MAHAFLLTTRRVPHLYYGDEIAMGAGSDRTDASIRADFPGGWRGDPVNAFLPDGRAGDAAVTFDRIRELLHFRQAHPALKRGNLVQLLVNRDQYAYLRRSSEDYVLVVLNREGSGKPIELDMSDLGLRDGLTFRAMSGTEEVAVTGGRILLREPKDINIYWAK
jgi:glycosidase